DKVAAVWSRNRDASIADYRSEKDVRPTHLDGNAVHYIYSIDQSPTDVAQHIDVLTLAARSMTHLGWGIDMVVADAGFISATEAAALPGDHWRAVASGAAVLRCP